MSEKPIIVIVDDEQLVRDGIKSLLRSVGYEVKAFESVEQLRDEDALSGANCLILDVRLPFTSGLEFQRKLVDSDTIIPTIFVTGHGDIPMTVSAMKAGAVDFLSKPFREQDLLDAVASAVQRSKQQTASGFREQDIRTRFQALSSREREIMTMATAGLLNKQIAGKLGLSEITVKIHRGKVNRKMMARTFSDLVRMAQVLSLHVNSGAP